MTQVSTIKFEGSFFMLVYPSSWEQEIIEDVVCFFKEDGCGALQMASTRSEDGHYNPEKEMNAYLDRNNLPNDPEKNIKYKTQNNIDAIACEYMQEGRFWLVQILCHEDKMLIVLYNADEPPEQSLSLEISSIISSIKFNKLL